MVNAVVRVKAKVAGSFWRAKEAEIIFIARVGFYMTEGHYSPYLAYGA